MSNNIIFRGQLVNSIGGEDCDIGSAVYGLYRGCMGFGANKETELIAITVPQARGSQLPKLLELRRWDSGEEEARGREQ